MDDAPTAVLQDLQAVLKEHPLPPVHKWHPEQTRESRMRIASNGDWFYQESKIERMRMVRMFASILRKDDDDYYLVTPAERLRIDVEDAPFIAVLLRVTQHDSQPQLTFTTNMGDEVVADAAHRIVIEYSHTEADPSPYIEVRNGLRALMNRSVYYQMAELAETNEGQLGVYSDGVFMALAQAEAE